MNIENIRVEFPEMPEEIRDMIRDRVEEQVRLGEVYRTRDDSRFNEISGEQQNSISGSTISRLIYAPRGCAEIRFGRCQLALPRISRQDSRASLEQGSAAVKTTVQKHHRSRRMALAIFAAAMILSMTALAGGYLYWMHVEKIGTYGAKISVDRNTGVQTEEEQRTEQEAVQRAEQILSERSIFENPTVRAAWIPEGMTASDNGYRIHMEGDYGSAGITIALWDAEGFDITDTYVENAEEITVAGHDAVYITKQGKAGRNEYNHDMYIFYPEAGMVVQLMLSSSIAREDAVRFAEGLEVVEKSEEDPVVLGKIAEEEDIYIRTMKLNASTEEMGKIYQVGEPIVMPYAFAEYDFEDGAAELTVEVSDVEVWDSISQLDPAYMEAGLLNQADAEGLLLPNTIQYIKRGDGIDTLDEVLYTEEVEQRIIYATLKYSNTGEAVLNDILFYVCLMKIQEENGMYSIYKREAEIGDIEYDQVVSSSMASDGRMIYWDVEGGNSNGNNYINRLAPGETVTIHMGFLANVDELEYLYLSPAGGSAYEFSETALETGYIDIRSTLTKEMH